jgi:transcriptional regulator GlxA family with amidase domain
VLRLGYIVFPGFQMMGFAGMSAFEYANATLEKPWYDVRLLSENGGTIASSLGMRIETESFAVGNFDTIVVGGGPGPVVATPGLIAYVRQALRASRRVASICTGAFVLADAGALAGRRATTHWAHTRELRRRFPDIKVEEDRIFVTDGPVWTSAGLTAGIDLAVGMVEHDLGTDVARRVAKILVMHHRRAGGQSQHSALLDLEAKSDRIQSALVYAKRHLQTPLAVEQLAAEVNLSPRQFSRAFRAETGQSPAKAVETLRVEAARVMLEQGRHSIEAVADETGFADRERMRRAFLRAFGQPPQAMRRAARKPAAE